VDKFSWRGLYALGLLLAGLLTVDAIAPVSRTGHELVGVVFLLVIFALVFLWTEEHADLVEHEGIDSLLASSDAPAAHGTLFIAGGESLPITRESASSTSAVSDASLAVVEGERAARSVRTPG
jgi:hypothetical protein